MNTHTPASLYHAFPPEEARRIARKLDFHHTPKYASWLNMTGIEFSVLERQCLGRRLATREGVSRQGAAWENHRNQTAATIH